jgi:hypothetical protein
MSSRKTCGMDGCERDYLASGLCHRHYAAERERERKRLAREYKALLASRGETWERDPAIGPPGHGCHIDGCDQPHHGLGLCRTHYHSALRRETARLAREYRALLSTEEVTQ